MKLLLDTHVLLWAAGNPQRLSDKTHSLLIDESNELFFSSASIWEIVIKNSLGRADFEVNPVRLFNLLLQNGYRELTITSLHTLAVASLPAIHKDPFDRILLSQASCEGLWLITADHLLQQYSDRIVAAN